MRLCFDATRFGLGWTEAIEFAAVKKLNAVEFAFEPFETTTKTIKLSEQEKAYLAEVDELAKRSGIAVACIRLDFLLDVDDKKAAKNFQQMMDKLGLVAQAVGCNKLVFYLKPSSAEGWIERAAAVLNPVAERLEAAGVKLLLSTATPEVYRGKALRHWRPFQPQEWRDLLAYCPGLALSFSAADCAWQSIDYLQVLPGIVTAIEHVEANDVEINRPLLVDSGLFGPLWWRYRRPGKGQIDWQQLTEALKLYDYQGMLSIHLDDEFIGDNGDLEDCLDDSIKLLMPLVKY